MFKETHPILGTRDIQRAIQFYIQQLGFKLAFGDKADPPNYVGFRRDAVELHMQPAKPRSGRRANDFCAYPCLRSETSAKHGITHGGGMKNPMKAVRWARVTLLGAAGASLAGCGTTLISHPIERQSDGWTIRLVSMAEEPAGAGVLTPVTIHKPDDGKRP